MLPFNIKLILHVIMCKHCKTPVLNILGKYFEIYCKYTQRLQRNVLV